MLNFIDGHVLAVGLDEYLIAKVHNYGVLRKAGLIPCGAYLTAMLTKDTHPPSTIEKPRFSIIRSTRDPEWTVEKVGSLRVGVVQGRSVNEK